jgi:hypothetical protein
MLYILCFLLKNGKWYLMVSNKMDLNELSYNADKNGLISLILRLITNNGVLKS